jgi:hypothetical protein
VKGIALSLVAAAAGKCICVQKNVLSLNYHSVVSVVHGRILDVSIIHPGSTSDGPAFQAMTLFPK